MGIFATPVNAFLLVSLFSKILRLLSIGDDSNIVSTVVARPPTPMLLLLVATQGIRQHTGQLVAQA